MGNLPHHLHCHLTNSCSVCADKDFHQIQVRPNDRYGVLVQAMYVSAYTSVNFFVFFHLFFQPADGCLITMTQTLVFYCIALHEFASLPSSGHI